MSTLKFRIRIFFKYKDLLIELIKRDIKLKYRRSLLGYVWSVLNPLLIMIVMTVVFSAMFKRDIENYPIYLLTGRTLFEFMRSGTQSGLKSVQHNAPLLKKTYIPKYIFTIAKVSSIFIDTVFSMGAFFIVMIATRSPFYIQLLYLLEQLPHLLQVFVKTLNPMYYYIAQFRDIALYGRMPGMRLVVGGWIWAIAMMVFGLFMFQKNKDRFVLYL